MANGLPFALLADVGLIQRSNAVIGQPGPIADGVGTRLVPNHAQCQTIAL